ncbi:MAG: cupin domain-containing protein [Bacteroidales bacterium]|nr:cupin domain-containing protein [Bacteroidales bacterium]
MSQSKAFFVAKEEKIYPAGEKTTRQFVAYDDNIMMVKVMFETGAVGPVHTHPHVQTCYVAKGKFEIDINGEKKILEAGDGFLAEPNIPHGVKCIEEGILIDVFNPCRKDFLETI